MGLGGQRHALAALPPAKRPGTHFTRVWVGLRTGLDGCGNSHPTHWNSISVASRYSDYTMPVRNLSQSSRKTVTSILGCDALLVVNRFRCFEEL